MEKLKRTGNESIIEFTDWYEAYQEPYTKETIAMPCLFSKVLREFKSGQSFYKETLVINHEGAFLVEEENFNSNRGASAISWAPTQYNKVEIKKLRLENFDPEIWVKKEEAE